LWEKGKRMKYLEELESKVFHLIDNNKELSKKLEALTEENALLKELKSKDEAALSKEVFAAKMLVEEKEAMIGTIEKLLGSIKALENTHERAE